MTDPAVLEPIIYEKLEHGWRVPATERERFYNPPRIGPPRAAPKEQAKPVQQLVVELEQHISLGLELEHELRELYEREPLRVSRACDAVLEGIAARRLHTPGGLLRKLLRDIGRVT